MSSVLSTLRSLGTRLSDHFWWLLSHLPAPADSQLTLGQLNDDCLLLILPYFTVPELLQLRAVSHRFAHLIEAYRLPQCKTLLYGYSNAERSQREDYHSDGQMVDAHFANRHHVYSQLHHRLGTCRPLHIPFYSRPRRLFPLQLSTLPLSLPLLLPRLTSLTFTHYLMDEQEQLTNEQVTVNKLCTHYLRSSWCDTLVSLHLYLVVPDWPHSYHAFFWQLNKLPALAHLFLEFSLFVEQEASVWPLIPDYLPVLAQLEGFSLTNYGGLNTATLLSQLGPNLTFLSLNNVTCSVEEFSAFLAAKHSYGQTLKRVEVFLRRILDWQLVTVCARYLLSLEKLNVIFASPDFALFPFFTELSQLTSLEEMSYLPLYIEQLRALYLMRPLSGTLPRLSSIRQVTISIFNTDATFQPEELFDNFLPLLAEVFCGLETLNIGLCQETVTFPDLGKHSEPLSVQLANRTIPLFKGLRYCLASYYCRT